MYTKRFKHSLNGKGNAKGLIIVLFYTLTLDFDDNFHALNFVAASNFCDCQKTPTQTGAKIHFPAKIREIIQENQQKCTKIRVQETVH
jgi:hypothetical protein